MSIERDINRNSPETPPGSNAFQTSFWFLIIVMFQIALSDNIYRYALKMMILKHADVVNPGNAEAAMSYSNLYTSISDGLFLIPYILAATVAGGLADRYSKSKVIFNLKLFEMAIMTVGIVAFALGHIYLSLAVLFFMGIQAALFSPTKYGILPELLSENKLGWGNGILQGGTFLAIILGTIIGPTLFSVCQGMLYMAGVVLVILAGLGAIFALRMIPLTPANPDEKMKINPWPMIKLYGGEIFRNNSLKWCMFGMAAWWLVAIMLQDTAILVANKILKLGDAQTGYAMLPIVIGLGLGCFITGAISKNRIELGLVPFGAVMMFAACLLCWHLIPNLDQIDNMTAAEISTARIIVPLVMGLAGLVCGFFIVPLQAYFVNETDPALRGGVWAVSNIFTTLGMIIGVGFKMAIIWFTSSPGLVFLESGVLILLVTFLICYKFPYIPLRFIILFFLRFLYRINVKGVENIPKKGGALLTPNHQSYIDAILISASIDRPVRFIIAQEMYKIWFIYPFAKLTRSIPVKPLGNTRDLINSLREAGHEVERGGLVCIFPEGQMTRLGMTLAFRRGFEHIMRKVDAPIIPVAIDGAYDTAFARRGGFPAWHLALEYRRTKKSLNVVIGEQMPPKSTHHEVRRKVMDLMVEAFAYRKQDLMPIHREALFTLRRNLFKKAVADHNTNGLIPNYKFLAGAIALGTNLKKKWQGEEYIGILLPPTIASSAVNLAATIAGKITVNLNYTVSSEIIDTICAQTNIKTIITSKAFLEKVEIKLPQRCKIILLEDIKEEIGCYDRFMALINAIFKPSSILEKMLGREKPASMDDVCTIIFSSGTTGVPKGVELTHWNVLANVIATVQMVYLTDQSRFLGILPFFHSFGYTVVFWLPLVCGLSVVYHPNPLHGREIGNFVEKYRVTHLITSPTILATYTRRIQPFQFGSLEMVLTGSEKLRSTVAEKFAEIFGIHPIEGFGATECSPIVCLNTPDIRRPGIYQKGTVYGTIGNVIPGVTVKIVDPDTGEDLGINKPGMLCVKGHNVMRGYYKMPEKTAEVLKDGWYYTGDIAQMDGEGFITITDRLSRFSKIGGEMIPHIRIEQMLYHLSGYTDTVFAVTGIPDEKKGERIVVLYAMREDKARKIADMLQESELPPLWKPKWPDFIKVEEIPVIGTGKLDLKRIKQFAEEKIKERG